MNHYHAQLPDTHRIYGRTADDCGKCPAGVEDVPEPLRRGAFVPNACYAGKRSGPLGHLRLCKPISAYHRRKHRRLSFDRCAHCNEVPFRQRSIERLTLGRREVPGWFPLGTLSQLVAIRELQGLARRRSWLRREREPRKDFYRELTLGPSKLNSFYFWTESSAYLRQ
jgi:hypothetical protein